MIVFVHTYKQLLLLAILTPYIIQPVKTLPLYSKLNNIQCSMLVDVAIDKKTTMICYVHKILV